MKGFVEFIRERGIVGFAVGFILGGAITKVVASLVTDIVNPVLGLILSRTKSLESMYFQIGSANRMRGYRPMSPMAILQACWHYRQLAPKYPLAD